MLIGTIVLLVGIVHAAGGLSHAVETPEAIDPKLVTPEGADDILSPTFMTSFWVLVCFGVIGLPHTAVRCISYKDSKAVHRGIIIGTIVVAILMLGMHLAGALGRAVIPDLTVPDTVIPTLMVKVLPLCCRDFPCRTDGRHYVDDQRSVAAKFRYDYQRSLSEFASRAVEKRTTLKADVCGDHAVIRGAAAAGRGVHRR